MKEKIFLLKKDELSFPDASCAPKNLPLAIGADLNPKRLILAYKSGIFPWYEKNSPILWWSPDPRFVLFINEMHISHSLSKVIKKNLFQIFVDHDFEKVIKLCAKVKRKNQQDTWITDEMIEAYINLYKLGYAHSIEAYLDGNLVGGLYGVCIGSIFFGESMFHIKENASKVAFAKFLYALKEKTSIDLIDCQVYTDYLASFGARLIPRDLYLKLLKERIDKDNKISNWKELIC